MQYRKKPVIIEAFQYDGDFMYNTGDYYIPQWGIDAYESGILYFGTGDKAPWDLYIKTLEGDMFVSDNDYIIKGVKNELYPCKPDIFEMTYDKVFEGEIASGTIDTRVRNI